MMVRSDDAELYYEVLGQGAPIVLLHPLPADRGIWKPVAEMLSTRYRVILPDLRGHGASGLGEGVVTMEKHAGDVLRICREAGVETAVFAGISLGGYILFELWRRAREQVKGLILCDTRAGADSEEARRTRLSVAEDVVKRGPDFFFDGMVPKLLGTTTLATRPDIAAQVRAMMAKMSAPAVAAVQRGIAARADSTPTLKTIDVPALVVVGEEDAVTPVAEAQVMHRGIRGSGLKVIAKAGHVAAFEQPEEVHRVMRQYLTSMVV
ncbi:MAG TPA: alpha/beta fold hydrolase [Terriglobales bacterium]|nr:alpha/beta fold hydrolase [Terriglobales bacterium]